MVSGDGLPKCRSVPGCRLSAGGWRRALPSAVALALLCLRSAGGLELGLGCSPFRAEAVKARPPRSRLAVQRGGHSAPGREPLLDIGSLQAPGNNSWYLDKPTFSSTRPPFVSVEVGKTWVPSFGFHAAGCSLHSAAWSPPSFLASGSGVRGACRRGWTLVNRFPDYCSAESPPPSTSLRKRKTLSIPSGLCLSFLLLEEDSGSV